jgi:hypothetical protein
MRREWRAAFIACFAIFPFTVLAQKVIASSGIPCHEETVRSNLKLKDSQHISGQLEDATGAPFVDSQVLLRIADSNGKFVAYRTVNTDKEGRFDFGKVDAGNYRFLPAPTRGFKQPKEVTCAEGRNCELKLVLQVNPTDQEFAGCPIQ